jgi:hypothetical protein
MGMPRSLILAISVLFGSGRVIAPAPRGVDEFGFIDMFTDSMNVPFFVDGFYVGIHPLSAPIPVLPGFHEVSYIPPDFQDETVRDDFTDGIPRVYVAKNDTLEVFLFYDHFLSQVETLQEEMKMQNYVGFSLFGVLIYVLLSVL